MRCLTLISTLVATMACSSTLLAQASAPSTRPSRVTAAVPAPVPPDFPRFAVPGLAGELNLVRQLFWLHYPPAARAGTPTLYDDWMASAALWPALAVDVVPAVPRGATSPARGAGKVPGTAATRSRWRETLSSRVIDDAGYVGSHQHLSMAHPLGWPLPPGHWGSGGAQWHFSFLGTIGPPYRHDALSTPDGWTLSGVGSHAVKRDGWHLSLHQPRAFVTSPIKEMKALEMPFLLVNWRSEGLTDARPYIEWTTPEQPEWSEQRRTYLPTAEPGEVRLHYRGRRPRLAPMEADTVAYQPIAMFKHPAWRGDIRQLRLCFDNPRGGGNVVLQALVSSYDTRHNVNNQAFIMGCATYLGWSGDIPFLRENISRMRRALRFMQEEYETLKNGYVSTTWPGHDGASGIRRDADQRAVALPGRGVGSNYWDLLPFGGKDAYATILYYGALQRMIEVERQILRHPEWAIPQEGRSDVAELEAHASHVKLASNKLFWNTSTGRFVGNIDDAGVGHDYGFTFVNLEAVHYGLASDDHAKQIMAWLSGERTVAGDTSQGKDIYHWRFGPRSTTLRNLDYYTFWWSEPERTAWGTQVQDGGAVLAFSYHDLMARLKVSGPDDAWARLSAVIEWCGEVDAAGGYRAFYASRPAGATLQGGGSAGGLGMDHEFKESVLLPQVMLDGFMGFIPRADGFSLNPRLPRAWPELSIDRIAWHDQILHIRASDQSIQITAEPMPDVAPTGEACWISLPPGEWDLTTSGAQLQSRDDGARGVRWDKVPTLSFRRKQ